ncbi:dihydroorotase [Pseudofulvimonas gallinarii]|uniref:Dihydroorotase n=2 Tax=Pseudofulvimonas gallinarii TaxID=634155 RepID=A0A4R3LM65_9GAMM|nr:dihydroorotase [Pseudofulvimonas gallinarii]
MHCDVWRAAILYAPAATTRCRALNPDPNNILEIRSKMNRNWLIKEATIVNDGRVTVGDLRVRAGRIEAIGTQFAARKDETVVDAGGLWLLPGMIDDQVHFREPGFPHKGDIGSESAAAVSGGITSFMDMPNTDPPTLGRAALDDKYARAAGRAFGNFGFYMGASNDNLEAIKAIDPTTTPGVKVFMGASTGNMLVDDPGILDGIFAHAPTVIITHCEDTPTIQANMEAARQRHGDQPIPVTEHPLIRSREACITSTRLALSLARRHDARLHVLHISTADELALFEAGPMAGKRITAETCVHFLHFCDQDYDGLGTLIQCNPAIKTAADRAALIAAVADGRIDILATDHAPHTREEKSRPYPASPSGLPLVQFALVSALEHVHDGHLDLPTLVERIAHAPAERFGVVDRGWLREGYAADLVLVDPAAGTDVTPDSILGRCGWSPFEGAHFRSRVVSTWVNGHRAWHEGELSPQAAGERLAFSGAGR